MTVLYSFKQWFRSLRRYPQLQARNLNYNQYWHERKLQVNSINEFQLERARMVAASISIQSTLLDIGCGNGMVLKEINSRKPLAEKFGVDVSEVALNLARENGVQTLRCDIANPQEREQLPHVDYILLFEVLEHLTFPEELLGWAVHYAQKGVFMSVPNTGFLFHRLRLLFGKFPLQWKVNPSEHIRFWTWRDMQWWLNQLGLDYRLKGYQGVPGLNRIMPSLFAQGLFVQIKRQ
ncbi:MAG: class I SAM-dependent methyltransferase [Candidatus Yanofskybacteria bacterium]|nr:class I SAM-dependent methyltransferase [Candidatus Yanofskybacteria bacterium]